MTGMTHNLEGDFARLSEVRLLRVYPTEDALCVEIMDHLKTQWIMEFRWVYGERIFKRSVSPDDLARHNMARCGVYCLENSEFLSLAASAYVFEELPEDDQHFAIVSTGDVVEVICGAAPIVRRATSPTTRISAGGSKAPASNRGPGQVARRFRPHLGPTKALPYPL